MTLTDPTSLSSVLVRRHFALMEDEQAIAYYWFIRALEAGPALAALMASMGRGSVVDPVPAPVIAPEPEPVAPAPVPEPWTTRPRAPDGLRQRFGLR